MTNKKKKFYDERTSMQKLLNPANRPDIDIRSEFLHKSLRESSHDAFHFNECHLLLGGYQEYLDRYVVES